MARLKQIVIDCHHPASLARFWAAALDDFEVRPYDADEIARLAALGLTPETDPAVILDGPFVELCFQQVGPPPMTKKPLHLDLRADDREGEVRRLSQLGASITERFETHTWMRDPEGNDFCIVDA
jgi:glyoxalase superfamily protein